MKQYKCYHSRIVFYLIFLTIIFSGAFVHADNGSVILPGRKIGNICLGFTEQQVHKILGKPDDFDSAAGPGWDFWRTKVRKEIYEMTIRYDWAPDGYHRVTQILATNPVFHTVEGISTASSIKAIWAAYPNIQYMGLLSGRGTPAIEIYDDNRKGIAFEILHINKAGSLSVRKCYAIIVHQPGSGFLIIGTLTYPPSGYGERKSQ